MPKQTELALPGVNPPACLADVEQLLQGLDLQPGIEKLYRKAKNPEKLYAAIKWKLEAQREIGIWWHDEGPKRDGKRGKAKKGPTERSDLFPDESMQRQFLRWYERYHNPEKFARLLEETHSKCWQICEAHQSASFSSEDVEWYTPAPYIESVRRLLGDIDLDPASSKKANRTVKAGRIYTEVDNGLELPWVGSFFLNPPYGTVDGKSVAGLFCQKAIDEYETGGAKEGIILVNSLHSQKWQEPLFGYPVCLVDHRIAFVSGDGEENKSPTNSNLFIYLGRKRKAFATEFSQWGYCVELIE